MGFSQPIIQHKDHNELENRYREQIRNNIMIEKDNFFCWHNNTTAGDRQNVRKHWVPILKPANKSLHPETKGRFTDALFGILRVPCV